MLEIPSIHERQHICLLFLAGILLSLTINPSFSSKHNNTRCFENDRMFLYDMRSGCMNQYNHSYFLDCCNLPGISCSNLTGRIIGLDLFQFLEDCLFGEWKQISLSPSLVSLDNLVTLNVDLSLVSFSKGFQSFIGSFPNLRHLSFTSYEVQRMAVPLELGNLTRLETLEVYVESYSTMYAKTLRMLSRFTSLKRLVLSYVTLSQATDWLHVVSNLPNLEHLDLSYCHLPNVIYPSQRSDNPSKSLTYLDLSFNNLKTLPSWSWVFNHSSLISLYISNSQLSGSIPNRFRGMISLSHLDLSYNRLEGQLPSSLQSLCDLCSLDVSENHRLQGDLSRIFQSLSCAKESLTVLSLHRNLFTGSLPDFTIFSRLSKLSLHSNRLNGSLPSYARRPSSLTVFNVHNNQISGSVHDLSAFRSLKVLQLQNNKLNGSVHPGLGQLSMLRHLDISSNSVEGDLGITHLANLSSLRYLDISFNSLTLKVGSGWVPPFRLDTIGFASCDVGSRFPQWLRTQINYSRLDMSNSGILDTIPFWFWNLSSVATFISLSHNRLHGNNLTGSITSKIGSLKSLESLDLSNNHLSGEIPSTISVLNFLGTMSLANNNFSGKIPTGTQIQGFDASAFAGNSELCGEPLSNKCPGDGDVKGGGFYEDGRSPKDNNVAFDLGLYISVLLGVITGFWGVSGVLMLKRSWRFAYFRFWNNAYNRFMC